MRRLVTALAAVVLLASCTDNGPADDAPSSTTETTAGSTTTTAPLAKGTLDAIDLDLELVAELDEPIALAARPGSPDLYIAEKAGRVRLIEVEDENANTGSSSTTTSTTEPAEPGDEQVNTRVYREQRTPLLDISDQVINEGERGLLGMAFSNDGRKVYLDYTRQPDGFTVVVEYTLGDSLRIDKGSRREILVVEQPLENHNGGQLVIGPDGYLYIGLGDGGDRGDLSENAQETSTLLGSILRIDPEAGDEDGPAYGIPPGNPFADGEDGKPEIWLYGTRNPWRFTFDRANGDLWVADVGQHAYEEIDHLPADGGFEAGRGDNLGWNQMEGTHSYEGGENPPGAVLPVFDYGRDEGCSVIGGYVYRGEDIPDLQGTYLYSDYCGRGVRGLQVDGDTVIDTRTWDLDIDKEYSFGQGDDGELYVLLEGGRVVKLVPAG